jgi:hypothetical protein
MRTELEEALVREEVADRCLQFLADRYRGNGNHADWDGAFSTMADAGDEHDLFGSLDAVYILAILRRLGPLTTPDSRTRWCERILEFQGPDGWFRANDRQRHHPIHASAYALGALALLAEEDGRDMIGGVKPIHAGSQLPLQLTSGWDRLPLAQRLHFWRGSHRIAGFAAIVGQLSDAGHMEKLPSVKDAGVWLGRWAANATESIDPQSGSWSLVPRWLESAFGMAYQIRHRPEFGHIGGAAHVYWILHKLNLPMPAPAATVDWIMNRAAQAPICEGAPYCLDFDRAFLLARNAAECDTGPEKASARRFLSEVRRAVLGYYYGHERHSWHESAHKLPGGLACVAEVDRSLSLAEARPEGGYPWRDVFDTVWWL